MAKWLGSLGLVLLLVSCAALERRSTPRAPILKKLFKGPASFHVLGTGSEDPQALCKGFRLSDSQAERYFMEALEVGPPTETDGADLFSCYVRGFAKNGGQQYPWTIRVDGRGQMKVSSTTQVWFACPACAERFTGH